MQILKKYLGFYYFFGVAHLIVLASLKSNSFNRLLVDWKFYDSHDHCAWIFLITRLCRALVSLGTAGFVG